MLVCGKSSSEFENFSQKIWVWVKQIVSACRTNICLWFCVINPVNLFSKSLSALLVILKS